MMSHDDPRLSSFDIDDGDGEGAEIDESAPALPTTAGYSDDPAAGYADDPNARREMDHVVYYRPASRAMCVIKSVCGALLFLGAVAGAYLVGKSSNANDGSSSSAAVAAAASSPEADFESAEHTILMEPPAEAEEGRMELLRASIGASPLTLDDVIREADEWDEDAVPAFPSTIDVSGLSDTGKLLFTFLAKYPFARDFVVEMVVDDYTAPESPDYAVGPNGDIYARLDNALEAMELYEVDYEPVPIDGHPFLFVGSVGASLTYGSLMKAGVTHVVDLSETAKCETFNMDIEYFCGRSLRTDDESLALLDDATKFIEHARKKGGKVLSHCWYGTTHSATLTVAYLMKYEEMPMKEAIELVKTSRPAAEPRVHVLEKYAKQYLGE